MMLLHNTVVWSRGSLHDQEREEEEEEDGIILHTQCASHENSKQDEIEPKLNVHQSPTHTPKLIQI